MRTRTAVAARARLAVQILEERTVPAVAAYFVNGVLNVFGDSTNNAIDIGAINGQIAVSGVAQTFAGVGAITVDGGSGDDRITVSPFVAKPTMLFGGDGNDVVTGGSANDQLYGGAGNDVLDGGGGNDQLFGGGGGNLSTDAQGSNAFSPGSVGRYSTLSAIESQIVALVNQQRAAAGLAPLIADGQLTFAAQQQSTDMAALSAVVGLDAAMSHTSKGSLTPSLTNRADYVGFDYSAIGENIAYGYSDAASVMQAWMNSAGHRANILSASYTRIGVGVRANAQGVLYFTEEFGTPAPGAATPAPATPAPTPTPAPAPAPVVSPKPLTTPVPQVYAVGASAGGGPRVIAISAATGQKVFDFFAYATNFTGGVRVATGDVNGDSYDDLITAPGAGGGPHIKVFDGRTGNLIRQFMAYSSNFTGGVYVAAGDVNGDGNADIITGVGTGGGPHVKAFSGNNGSILASFMAYDAKFRGGAMVAAGDVNGDGRADIVTGTGPGGGAHVKAFDGRSLQEFRSFFAFDPSMRGGVTVAAGDVNGDGKADIVAGCGPGADPHVRVFDGQNLRVLQDFTAFAANYRGGVRVATDDLNGDGRADLLVAPGSGMASEVKVFSGSTMAGLRNFTAFDPSFMGGVYVG